MSARCVMVLGTSSGAGKSWITTALCRAYADMGLKVAPFKAQNMSNNARVVATADERFGEIGSAQYFQALASRALPTVDMNPVLLKPEADTESQVVVCGQVDQRLSQTPWRERSALLWPHAMAALDRLRASHDVVVIEGAGSPAEINLMESDYVNLRVARHANAACLLVTDIDRGGAFAHLYGTWALLPESDRALIHGFVLNKFRGDAALLAPGPADLEQLTGTPTVGVLPWMPHHGLPDEDGVFGHAQSQGEVHLSIAIMAWPHISNLDEFQPLRNVDGVRVIWARTPSDCAGADWLILPGSKDTVADLAWLRERGLDHTVAQHAKKGGRVLGICGGLQMLGEALIDPEHIAGNAPGLGLLPLVTQFQAQKIVRPTQASLPAVTGAWHALSGVTLAGYEIHQGITRAHAGMAAAGETARELIANTAWQSAKGNVLGLYIHGMFENPACLRALLGEQARNFDQVCDQLAEHWRAHTPRDLLKRLISTQSPA